MIHGPRSILPLAMVVCLALAAPAGAQQPTPPPATEEPKPSADASTAVEITLPPRPALTFKGQSNWDDGYETLMKAFAALRAEAARLGLAVAGKPQSVFSDTNDTGFKFTAMLALEKAPDPALKTAAGMAFATSPEGRAFVFSHVGAYDDIDSVYEAITAWLDEKGLTAKGEFIEEYLNEPQGSDDALLQLKIYVFVK
jgi:effector-binding domain-containing protein